LFKASDFHEQGLQKMVDAVRSHLVGIADCKSGVSKMSSGFLKPEAGCDMRLHRLRSRTS